nr:hypothetical protein [Tanacetum cinerariifolium]
MSKISLVSAQEQGAVRLALVGLQPPGWLEVVEETSGEQVDYDVDKIDSAYETQYHVEYSEDAGKNGVDDKYNDLLVDEENEIAEPDVDVHLFGISKDVLFDNIDVTSLVLEGVLEGEDVDVKNLDGFDSD